MTRHIFGLVLLLAAAPLCMADDVVVLTDTPVAEFTMPDGSVLKNAFVWRRSSDGLMIVHDDGQIFLNFKLLPNDWRAAYGLEASETVPTAESSGKREDRYLIHPILIRVPDLYPRAYTFYTSRLYEGEMDETVLSACMLQSIIDGRRDKAARLREIILEKYPESTAVNTESLFLTCQRCSGEGGLIFTCKTCSGSGKCPRCVGGRRTSDLTGDPIYCTTCRGTGKCLVCGAKGTRKAQCPGCGGRGKVLVSDEAEAQLARLVEELNAAYTGQ